MKLFRHGLEGYEKPGIVMDGIHYDLSHHTADFTRNAVSIDALEALKKIDKTSLQPLEDGFRFAPCVGDPSNFFCIGLNYARHAQETNSTLPSEPMVFNKASTALAGAHDDFIIDALHNKLDWEIELGFVIGKDAFKVDEKDALSYISGYFTANDISEREFQKNRGGQFVKGKSMMGAGPIGPYLVTSDDVLNPDNLNLEMKLNDEIVQSSNTSDLIFSVSEILSNMSHYMKLKTGDVILTGTPEGVGLGRTPPVFLKKGDVLKASVEGLGTQVKCFR